MQENEMKAKHLILAFFLLACFNGGCNSTSFPHHGQHHYLGSRGGVGKEFKVYKTLNAMRYLIMHLLTIKHAYF